MITSNSKFVFIAWFTVLICHKIAKKRNTSSIHNFVKSGMRKTKKSLRYNGVVVHLSSLLSFSFSPFPTFRKFHNPIHASMWLYPREHHKTCLNTYHTTIIQAHTSAAHHKTKSSFRPQNITRTISPHLLLRPLCSAPTNHHEARCHSLSLQHFCGRHRGRPLSTTLNSLTQLRLNSYSHAHKLIHTLIVLILIWRST